MAALTIAVSFSAVGTVWEEVPGLWGVTLRLPPGSEMMSHAEGITRVELPIPSGTLLTEFFLLLEAGTGLFPSGRPVWIGDRWFLAAHGEEGAAGSRYEWFRYATPMDGARWLSLTFVIRTAVPGMFPEPPPPYDRGAVLDMIREILAHTRFPAGRSPPT
ncbi:MAG: hypothetical protein GXO72_00795 [Caldiserica bacterium]|nr:hypothetical protein [Caldisericota bacterium]